MRFIKTPVFFGLFVSSGCYALETGNLTVIFSDTDGKPITNATVKVTTSKGAIWGYGNESEYYHYEGHSDSNGVASIDFGFRDADFDWDVETPSHYSQEFGSKRECFDSVVEESDYLHIDTNTVEGLARYEELRRLYYADDAESYVQYISKMQPKSVTYTNKRIVRSVRFYPKRNLQPMYVYGGWQDAIPLPLWRTVVTNGVETREYPDVYVDLMKCSLCSSCDEMRDYFKISDFKLVRHSVVEGGVRKFRGYIEFAPGCGAYKCKKNDDTSFGSAYAANSNAVFETRIPFSSDKDLSLGKITSATLILDPDEYMVMRTRAMYDGLGNPTNWCYSKIEGEIVINKSFCFNTIVFNPRPNDPNLEFDIKRNLARPKSR